MVDGDGALPVLVLFIELREKLVEDVEAGVIGGQSLKDCLCEDIIVIGDSIVPPSGSIGSEVIGLMLFTASGRGSKSRLGKFLINVASTTSKTVA